MKKNIYFKIIKIFIEDEIYRIEVKNIYNQEIKFIVEDINYTLEPQKVLTLQINNLNFDIIIPSIEETFNFDFNSVSLSGFGYDSYVETMNGPILLKDISDNVKILDKNGEEVEVEHLFIFKINKKNMNQPIIIDKSNCGINLPYSPLVMSMNGTIKIRKIILKGRQLYLNGKAKLFNFDDYLEYFHIKTEESKDFLINGFITNSIY